MEDSIGFKMVKVFVKSTNWTPVGRHLQFDWSEHEVSRSYAIDQLSSKACIVLSSQIIML